MTVHESMTPAERVRRVLVGEPVDHIPFTAYENKFFYGRAEHELRNARMSVIQRQPNFFIEGVRNCQKAIIRTDQNGTTFETIRVETSKGILERVDIPRAGNQPWNQKQFFESSGDYGPLREFLVTCTLNAFWLPLQCVITKEIPGDAMIVQAIISSSDIWS